MPTKARLLVLTRSASVANPDATLLDKPTIPCGVDLRAGKWYNEYDMKEMRALTAARPVLFFTNRFKSSFELKNAQGATYLLQDQSLFGNVSLGKPGSETVQVAGFWGFR
jgi:hypothetical protein